MKKETMAREWSYIWCGDSAYNSRYDDLVDGYLAGFDAGQAQLFEQASDGFEEWFSENPVNRLETEEAWQASALHSAKLLAEKDKEISQAKEFIKEMLLAMDWQGHSFQSTRFFVEFNCKNAEKIKALLGEE